ncbi:AMP-dependent synthetase/ligase [Actinoplanes sp. NPDC051494]|uniref:AMP-dependent synthetase/ligase n=1 Tax=Actinoplanes sp. NPDC051494 TaxID=3363907 RepID=UPI0037BD93D8
MTATPGGEATTLCAAFQATVARIPDAVALRTVGGDTTITWSGYAARAAQIAVRLRALGVGRGDTIALLLTNRPEFHLVDTAAQHLGAVPFSLYHSSSPEQIGHLLDVSGARTVVTERRLAPLLHGRRLENLIMVEDGLAQDGPDAELPRVDIQPGDLLTLVYTSGTTGAPKRVEITHANMVAMCRSSAPALGMRSGDRLISFLPSAHIADRWANHYLHTWAGTEVTTLADPREIVTALRDVRPTLFGGVPQVWRRIAAGLATLPPDTRLAALGLDQVRVAITSAAPAPAAMVEFLSSAGVPISEGWGMSEVSGLATLNPPGAVRPGTVGLPLPGVETRLADDGELLVRGPMVTGGHLDADGWLPTGDIATSDDDGYLTIVDRKKELIITAGGENIAPAPVEMAIRTHCPAVAHVIVAGDARPYLVALLVLDPEVPTDQDAVRAGIDAANRTLSRPEQIRAFEVVDDVWQPGGDLVTPTMKVRRRPALRAYEKHIDALYTGH